MKIFVASILSLLFFIPTIGTITYFNVLKSVIKSNVKAEIEDGLSVEELITFTFSKEEIQNLEWEHEKEFSYGGKMYDVINTKVLNEDTFEILCYEDDKETALQQLIASRIDQQFDNHPSKDSSTTHLFNFLQHLINVEIASKKPVCFDSLKNTFRLKASIKSIYLNQVYPPPQVIIS